MTFITKPIKPFSHLKKENKSSKLIWIFVICLFCAIGVSRILAIEIDDNNLNILGNNIDIVNGGFINTDIDETSKKDRKIIEKELQLELFEKIILNGAIDVNFSYGNEQSVMVSGPKYRFVDLISSVKAKELTLSDKKNIYKKNNSQVIVMNGINISINGQSLKKRKSEKLTVNIQLPKLSSCQINGYSIVKMNGGFKLNDFVLSIKGYGDFASNSQIEDLILNLNGAGDVSLEEADIKNADITIRGTGDVRAIVKGRCIAQINGVGNIKLYGEPEHVSKSIRGIGRVDIIN